MGAIDEATLRTLLDDMGGDREVVKDLMQSFLEEAPKQLAEGRQAASDKDVKVVQRAYHTLKSTAATFGALELSAACKDLEQAARGGAVPDVATVGRVEALFEAARKDLLTRLS